MKITKFKLVDGGRSLSIDGLELSRKSGTLITDKITRERKIPVPDDLKEAVENLKYSFLNLTGHWMPPFSNYIDNTQTFIKLFDKDDKTKNAKTHEILVKLWNHTRVNGVVINNNAFMIMGQIEVLDGKTIAINTPYIREDDDFHFFNETIDRIEIAGEAIVRYFTSDKLMIQDSTAFMLDFYKEEKEQITRIKSQTEKENYEEMFRLSNAAGDSRYLEENNPPKPGSEGDTTLHENKSTVDKESYKEAEGKEAEETW